VSTNDVFFGFHAVCLTVINIIQVALYERGRQKVSWLAMILIGMGMTSSIIWSICIASGLSQWIELLYYLSYIKLTLTFIKYCPQVYLNWKRKSTVGWNIINILLDLTGGTLSILQLLLDCWIDDDWTGITGNFAKFGLGFVSIFFDIIFITQHYYFYTDRSEPLIKDGLVNNNGYDESEVKGLVDDNNNSNKENNNGYSAVHDGYNNNSNGNNRLVGEVKSFLSWLTTQEKI